ncbi:triose-phosphate isomerase [Aphanothece hegewaldii CCALA 016]|uniref:Triosephosphate isomerase n=1 Tax=Aphanothece hegewaldii CCALA 016 TaxID=2107694 RepID=A0A2T1LVB4_9CHRO|nr:triose-phosphate isomerase [Aphanothece hegewaldii]PSF35556.1 triose-phosphate isomerase [Aphanothece hegewaldii CCALA 016]
MRKIIIAGNWKMHKTQAEALEFLQIFKSKLEDTDDSREIVLCAPFTSLSIMSQILHGGQVRLGAQNIHWEKLGAYTGEISGSMLTELGVHYVIVGHSERRQYFSETDETANLRLLSAQRSGLTPILCVGESKSQRDAGETESVIINQIKRGMVDVDQNNIVIAYEPIWAIGTGATCEASEANRVVGLIRQQLNNKDVPIQYGGSVKADNIDELMQESEIDGVLVGGASLDPAGFARIANFK